MIKFSPSIIFLSMLLSARFHQNCQAAFGCCEHKRVNSRSPLFRLRPGFPKYLTQASTLIKCYWPNRTSNTEDLSDQTRTFLNGLKPFGGIFTGQGHFIFPADHCLQCPVTVLHFWLIISFFLCKQKSHIYNLGQN